MARAVILANGDFPTRDCLLQILYNADFLIACDGAAANLESKAIVPSAIIGDLDSISDDLKLRYKDRLIHIREQESNDLSKAFYYCIKQGYRDFIILGATGKREDHTLANISLLLEYARVCDRVSMQSDYGVFEVYSTPCVVPCDVGMQISLFCLDKDAMLCSKGLKYPLNNLTLPLWANGTLNEALETSFFLESNIKTDVIVYKQWCD